MPESAGPRIAVTFVIALLLWVVLLAIGGELNVPSLALGVVLSALLVWWGERRRAARAQPPR